MMAALNSNLLNEFDFVLDEVEVLGEKVFVVDNVSQLKLIKYFLHRCELELKEEEPFYIFDVFDIMRKYIRWKKYFPRIIPFYAIKCHPHPLIIKILADLGIGFDCASEMEIKQILGCGVQSDRIIFANPIKFNKHLSYAFKNHVCKMTFDNSDELYKIKMYCPNASVVLRIFVESSSARCPLGIKFGAPLDTVPSLVRLTKQLELNLIGVSFHVGSGCTDANTYKKAIEDSHFVFEFAKSEGIHMKLLDIGGGYPGDFEYESSEKLFQNISQVVNYNIDKYFKEEDGFTIISEPGRFFVASAMQLITTVIAEAFDIDYSTDEHRSYYINDGVHGSFNCIVFDHFIGESYIVPRSEFYEPEPQLKYNTYIGTNKQNKPEAKKLPKLYRTTLFGVTGESHDIIIENELLPEIHPSDIIVFKNMGAYTRCAASNFSGHDIPRTFNYVYFDDLKSISHLLNENDRKKFKLF